MSFSKTEWDYLQKLKYRKMVELEEKYSDNYRRVLRSRIKKKAARMKRALKLYKEVKKGHSYMNI